MSEAKTTIERADEIVGCSSMFAKGGLLDCALPMTRDTYRRGAYVGWMQNLEPDVNPSGFDLPRGIEDMARCVVELHAASKPKGDGFPREMLVYCPNEGGKERVSVVKQRCGVMEGMSEAEQTTVALYIQRCLAPPVRRFLAAFECFDPTSDEKCSGEAFVVTTTTAACVAGPNGPVCWLKPRATK